jgi:NarL family two-component system response regulator LiaR
MIAAGAVCYVLKNSSIDYISNTISTVYAGHAVFSAEVTQVLFQPIPLPPRPDYGLTVREKEVLHLMVEGLNNRQIAESLIVSRSTIKFHVSSILQKLEVSNRIEAVALTTEQNLLA